MLPLERINMVDSLEWLITGMVFNYAQIMRSLRAIMVKRVTSVENYRYVTKHRILGLRSGTRTIILIMMTVTSEKLTLFSNILSRGSSPSKKYWVTVQYFEMIVPIKAQSYGGLDFRFNRNDIWRHIQKKTS